MSDAAKAFVDVARTIAKGDPSQWLVQGLEHFSEHYISKPNLPDDVEIEKKMLAAARYLEKWLPMYVHLSEAPYNFEYHECVDDTLTNLYEVIELLEKDVAEIPRRAGGPRPDLRRPICAAVCAEAYRVLHGRIEPYSQHLQDGCEKYWQACGNPPTGSSGGGGIGRSIFCVQRIKITNGLGTTFAQQPCRTPNPNHARRRAFLHIC